jgi:hypothetical protein
MNHTNYKKWLQGKLISSLKPCSAVVDSASFHNVQINRNPTSNARKAEMLSWLDKHGIRYSCDMTKVELYDLIKIHKPQYESMLLMVCLPGWIYGDQTTSLPSPFKPNRKNLGYCEEQGG